MQQDKLGVVISSGGWHTPPLYAVFMQALAEKGIKSYTPFIPTLGVIPNPITNEDDPAFSVHEPGSGWPTPDDDAAALEEDIVALIDQGRKVIILAHSNGGMAATKAAKPSYHWKTRASRGLSGGVIGVLCISAYLLPVGLSVSEAVGEATVPPYSKIHKHGKKGVSTPIRCREYFFSRVSQAESDFYEKLMRAQPIPRSRLTNDPYSVYPFGFVQCLDDKALPVEAQRQMCKARMDDGCKMKVYEEPFDHCPTISAVERMVEITLDFAAYAQML